MVNLVEMERFQRCLIRMQKLKRHHSVSEGSVKESYHTINNVNLCAERYAPLFDFPWPKSQSFCVAPPELSFHLGFTGVSVPCVFHVVKSFHEIPGISRPIGKSASSMMIAEQDPWSKFLNSTYKSKRSRIASLTAFNCSGESFPSLRCRAL